MKNQNVILKCFQNLIDCHGNQRFPRNDGAAILSIYSVILSKAKDLINRFFGLRPQNDVPVILNLFQDLKAFSLIELLISLIIISLLIAAFTPLITKKMKASDITVGSFGGKNNGDGTTIERNVTRDDCTRLNAVYVSAEETGDKPICVMKYNIGDGLYNESFEDVQICATDSSCTVTGDTQDDLTPTCWQGTTSSDCNANYGGYSGCNRTLCNWTGAKKLCENMGSGWRLPTDIELESFMNDKFSNKKLANGGLMFCSHSASSIAPRCHYYAYGCNGSSDNVCYPHHLWSSAFDSESAKVFDRRLDGSWKSGSDKIDYAFSARCVLDTVTETIKEVEKEVEVEKPTTPAEAPSEEFCAQFDAMYVPAKWSGSTDLCVTKYNVGDVSADGSGPTIPNSVTVVGVGNSCSGGNCCWKGTTANGCSDTGNGTDENASTYSGCNRTVCNWLPVNNACLSWQPKGLPIGTWRLPTSAEMAAWAANINVLSKNQGKNGLQLCDENGKSYGSAYCCYWSGGCPGANGNYCFPARIWTSTPTSSGHNVWSLSSGGLVNSGSYADNHSTVARCVYDGKKDATLAEVEGVQDKQKICDKYNAMYLPPKYTGTSDGMCVTKYNVGDDGGPTYSNYAAIGVNVVGVGNSCSGGLCCWQGSTANGCSTYGNGDSTYSGCNRTVCQYKAAEAMCENWNPDGKGSGKWRLPTSSEMATWASNIKDINHFKGTNGLQLCDENGQSYGSAYCCYWSGGCPGANGNYCFPARIWTSTPTSSGHNVWSLSSGGLVNSGSYADNHSTVARCVSTEVLK